MAKRASTGAQPPAKRARATAADLMSDESELAADEVMQRALEMQNEFEEADLDSDASSSQESMDHDDFEDLEAPEASHDGWNKLQAGHIAHAYKAPSRASTKGTSLSQLMQDIVTAMKAAPEIPEKPAAQAAKSLKDDLQLPAQCPDLSQVQWRLAFSTPASIQVDPFWDSGALPRFKSATVAVRVDVLVEMPAPSQTLFQEKDIKDYRYFCKRAYYLAALVKLLKKALGKRCTVEYAPIGQDKHLTSVVLKASQSKDSQIRIVPWVDASKVPFALYKLAPDRSNIRHGINLGKSEQPPATPEYNNALLHDCSIKAMSDLRQKAAGIAPNFSDTAILLSAWVRRHERLSQGLDSALTLVLASLLTTKGGLPVGSSALQLFRSTLDWLNRQPLLKRAVSLASAAPPTTSSLPTLLDPSGHYNLLHSFHTSQISYMQLRARQALRVMEAEDEPTFRSLFTPPPTPLIDFDSLLFFPASPMAEWTMAQLAADLARALGDRVQAFSVLRELTTDQVTVGLIYEATQATRLVDQGPSAEDPQACKAFRAFWHGRSELRRFKDGAVLESVVWEASSFIDRFNVPNQIVLHILQTRFGVPPKMVTVFSSQLDGFVSEPQTARHKLYQADPQPRGFAGITDAFEAFAASLRKLEGLPLPIKTISPSSPYLRHTATFVPGPRKTRQFPASSPATRYIPTADLVLSFETSNRWPDELEAIQKIKAAFLVRLADLIHVKMGEAVCTPVVDVQAPAVADHVAIDVLLPSGYAFRLRIQHDAEKALLAEAETTSETQAALQIWRARFEVGPRHHSAISTLHHLYPSYSYVVRLVARWIAAHLLSAHLPQPAIELLVAHVYLSGQPPSSPIAGFTRVLHLLSTWEWQTEPLMVPLLTATRDRADTTDLSKRVVFPENKAEQCKAALGHRRRADPHITRGAFCLATEDDLVGRDAGTASMEKLVAGRVTQLATAVLDALDVQNLRSGMSFLVRLFHADAHRRCSTSWQSLFATPLDEYDGLVHLNPLKLTRHHQSLVATDQLLKLAGSGQQTDRIPIDLDPATALVEQWQQSFGQAALFFHDQFGGHVVGVLFRSLPPRTMAASVGYPVKPSLTSGKRVELDTEALIEGLKRLGGDLIERVEVRRKA